MDGFARVDPALRGRPMKTFLILFCVAFIALMLLPMAMRAHRGFEPIPPTGMPASAVWLHEGVSMASSDPKGLWASCWYVEDRDSDRCKVVDYQGVLEYEGDYLPSNSQRPLRDDALHIQSVPPSTLWVWGRVEDQPVPVLPLKNGLIMVPSLDQGMSLEHITQP